MDATFKFTGEEKTHAEPRCSLIAQATNLITQVASTREDRQMRLVIMKVMVNDLRTVRIRTAEHQHNHTIPFPSIVIARTEVKNSFIGW